VRYYIPTTPLTVLVTLAAGTAGWNAPQVPHPPLTVGVALCLISAGVTVYIVTRVNLRLFFTADTTPERKAILARRWVRLNHVRLATLGTAATLLVWTLTRHS
jgi:uncharacterized membrane protein